MKISNYPSGFNGGVLIKNVPHLDSAPGRVFWVGNNATLLEGEQIAADNDLGGKGGTFLRPFASIDFAVGRCKADRGDIIYVRPGHVETISSAAALDLDVAGISVVGLGRGSKRPRLDFTATAGTVEVNADDISIINMNFHANVSAVAIGLSILTLATNCLVKDCVFDVEATTTDEFLISINAGVGCDGLQVIDTKIDMGLGGAATGIKLVGASAGIDIKGCRIVGDYSQACIAGITTLSTEVYIEDNFLSNGTSGNVGAVEVVEMLTGTTGVIRRNHSLCNVATIAAHYVADTMAFFENYATEDVGQAAGAVLRTGATSVTASADDA